MWALIIIAIVLFLLFKGLNNYRQNLSYQTWENILQAPDICSEDKAGIREMLIPDNINPLYYVNNMLYLSGKPFDAVKNSRSIRVFGDIVQRPMLPLWFIAAYPDVILFFEHSSRKEDFQKIIEKELGVYCSESLLENEDVDNKTLRAFVTVFKKITGKKPENSL